ncbi:MAG: alkaline phosphatase family protein [Streptomycetales bacterium]
MEVLCRPELAGIVDFVAWAQGRGDERRVVVANAGGSARLRRGGDDGVDEIAWGRNPVAGRDPMAFLPYGLEVADPSPPNTRNAYPYAAERLDSFFAERRSPDIAVVHTPRHYFPELGGHVGEHGSLDVIQSRAPLVVSGAGARRRGVLDEHVRLVDVAPTLAWLAGVDLERLSGLDGAALDRLVAPGARHVVGLLWDGAGSGDLLHLAAQGALPAVARLIESGCALRGGAVAEFPSVTLCNHTSALTGVGPGRHGVIGNAYYDRDSGATVVPNDATTWHRSAEWLRPGLMTVYEHVAAAFPHGGDGPLTASVNEPIDRGAAYSTMALVRAHAAEDGAAAMTQGLPDPRTSGYASQEWVAKDHGYARWTQVDDAGLAQMLDLWRDAASAPLFTWWNSVVTDAAHHAGGPRSAVARAALVDADRRLGVFLDRLDALGLAEETVLLLTADHGFERTDPDCRGHWGEALSAAGLRFREVGPGFLYLGQPPADPHAGHSRRSVR